MCFIGFRCGPVSVVSSFSRNCLYTLTTRGRALCPALLQYLCVSYNLLHVLETVLGDTTNLLAVKLSDVPSWRSWSTCPGSIGSTVFYWHWPQPNAMLVKTNKQTPKQSKKMKREKCNWPPLVQPLLFWVCLIVASPFVVVKWGCAGWWRTQDGQAGSEYWLFFTTKPSLK